MKGFFILHMMAWFDYNGKLLTEGTAIIGAGSRALRYGDGLFETIQSLDGKIIFADEHFARLWKGMQVLKFDLPRHLSPETLQDRIQKLLQKNGHTRAVRIRLSVLRGDGGLYDPVNLHPNFIIQSWALPLDHAQWNNNGLVLGLYKDARKNCDVLANLKHNNYLPYVLAALSAKEAKWNDAVLFNNYSRICDTTIANIFLVKHEHVFTPSLEEGCVAGIMRRFIITALKEIGIPVTEKAITEDELLEADEVFLTNSIKPIQWVKEVANKLFNCKLSSHIYNTIITPQGLNGKN